jgi:hypothetical protein
MECLPLGANQQGKVEYTKMVIRSLKSKDSQYNGQRTNNNLQHTMQNIIQNTKDSIKLQSRQLLRYKYNIAIQVPTYVPYAL